MLKTLVLMMIVSTGLLIIPSLEANAESYYADETKKQKPDYSYNDVIKRKLQLKKEMEEQKKLVQEKRDKDTKELQLFMKANAEKPMTIKERIKMQEDMLKQAMEKRKAEEKWIKSISKY